MSANDPDQPHLKRVLGRADLVLLFVVAIFNLNVVPSIAANGGVTVWLWIVSLLLFFWPQGIAVIELAHRYPGEGGVYLWAKEVFGDFHGFLSGWCYWTNNMLYVPTVMLYFVGVSVFVLGPNHQALADNKMFALIASLALLIVLGRAQHRGPGCGEVGQQSGRHRNRRCCSHFDWLGTGHLAEVWHNRERGRLPDSGESSLRAQFLWRDLFWTGWPGIGLGHGRRDPGSAADFARRRSLGRSAFRLALHRGHTHPADRGKQRPDQRAARHRAGCGPHGGYE